MYFNDANDMKLKIFILECIYGYGVIFVAWTSFFSWKTSEFRKLWLFLPINTIYNTY